MVKRKNAQRKSRAVVLDFSMPAEVGDAVRQNAGARYESLSQWFRNIVVPVLQRRGALPRK